MVSVRGRSSGRRLGRRDSRGRVNEGCVFSCFGTFGCVWLWLLLWSNGFRAVSETSAGKFDSVIFEAWANFETRCCCVSVPRMLQDGSWRNRDVGET